MPKNNLLSFFETLEALKKIPRTGWVERGVLDPESVSDHCFRMTVMAFALGDQLGCNANKLMQLSLLHDLHESVCGDLILDYSRLGGTLKGFSPAEKKKREHVAMKKLFARLPAPLRPKWTRLWKEADAGKTREARIIKELDRLEMLLQASEYERVKNYQKPIFDIFSGNDEFIIKDPLLLQLLNQIRKKTKKRAAGKPF